MSAIELLSEVRDFLARDHGHFLGGSTQMGGTGQAIDVVDPSSGEVTARISEAGEVGLDAAMAAARSGFEQW